MKNELINQLETALNKTTEMLAGFSQKDINISPAENSWSAAQVGRHLYKSTKGMDELLQAPSKPADRKPDEKAEELKQLFLNFDIKMKAPDFIEPENKEYNKEELLLSLKETNKKMLDAFQHNNLEEIAPLQEGHPLQGSTKLEILHFVTYHTMRHNHQLEKIRTQV